MRSGEPASGCSHTHSEEIPARGGHAPPGPCIRNSPFSRQISPGCRAQNKKQIHMSKNFTFKKLRIALLAVLGTVAMSAGATWPYSFTADGIYYRITSDTTVAVGYGAKTNGSYTGEVVIPATVVNDGKTYTVNEIADSAFLSCNKMTAITLPKTIKKMGYNSFRTCTKLATLNIEDIAAWVDIDINQANYFGSPTYYTKGLTMNGEALTEVVIPEGVTEVKAMAFANCKNITKYTFPSTLKKIGYSAFYHNDKLISVSLPGTFEEMAPWAFYYCQALTGVTIPENVKEIGTKTFYMAKLLENLKLPENLEKIDSSAFYGASALKAVDLPAKLKHLGHQAFQNTGLTKVALPEGLNFMAYHAFYGCKSLEEANIPASIDSIGPAAFYNAALKKFTIADSKETLTVGALGASNSFFGSTLDTLYIGRNLRLVLTTNTTTERFVFGGVTGVKQLTVGPEVTDLTQFIGSTNTEINTVICLGTEPPVATEFADTTYQTAKLIVPKGTKAAYQAADVWKNFVNIEESETTAITAATAATEDAVPVYYNLNGMRVAEPSNGIFIRVQAGKATKVLMK